MMRVQPLQKLSYIEAEPYKENLIKNRPYISESMTTVYAKSELLYMSTGQSIKSTLLTRMDSGLDLSDLNPEQCKRILTNDAGQMKTENITIIHQES